jgi:hypothetical protein
MGSMARHAETTQNHADSGDIGDLDRAAAARRRAARALPMSERLARVHALCKQISAVRGAARSD